MSEGFEGKNIVRLDSFRKKPEAVAPTIETSAVPLRELDQLISTAQAIKIAQDVVEKYDPKDGGTLFNEYLKEQRQDASLKSIEEYHVALAQKKEMVARWSINELIKYLQDYSHDPEGMFKMYLYCVADDLLRLMNTEGQ